jgi:methyl-accepting chemotaxis protein
MYKSASVRTTLFVLALPFAASGVALAAAQESTIFRYDGHDFVRVQTTMKTDDGQSAVNSKLDRGSPAYNALIKKISYTGKATLFGQTCDAHYAPLTDAGGKLTGAIFVANCDK